MVKALNFILYSFLLGVSNKQMEPAVVNSSSTLRLPRKGAWVVAVVTAVISPTRFYVQLPLGCKSPLAVAKPHDQYLEGM